MQFIQGQKQKFDALLNVNERFLFDIQLDSPLSIDVALFGLDSNSRLSDEAYMIFYNQPQSPCGAVKLAQNTASQTIFDIELQRLNPKIDRLVVTLAIDNTSSQGVMSQLQSSSLTIKDSHAIPVASFYFDGTLFAQEKAIMLFEVYKKDNVWRFNAIAQGFNGGLDKLIEHFGGEVANETLPIINQPIVIDNQNQTNVSLSKISLDKPENSHKVNLNKSQKSFLVEVIWIDNGDKNANNDDLDLRVGMLVQGEKEMHHIHAPKNSGSLVEFPYIKHLGDVKQASKDTPGMEKVEINTDIAKLLGQKVALVFSVYSAVSNGMVSIASLQPKMRMVYENQIVECVFNPTVSPKAKSSMVYTYVIGTAIIDEDSITLQHSGLTSKRFSEATPRLTWKNNHIVITVDGQPIFKK